MATKKKAVTKKAPVKKPVTKKAAQKRTRKPKETGLPPAKLEGLQDIRLDVKEDEYDHFLSSLSQIFNENIESTGSILRQIEVIDMRHLSIKDRFTILTMLESEGYLTTTVEGFVENLDNLMIGLSCDALSFMHNNKLVYPRSWDDVMDAACEAISRPEVHTHSDVVFSTPEPAYPEKTQIGNARYVRIE